MTVDDIMQQLSVFDHTHPTVALREAVAQRKEITPRLLQVIEEATLHPVRFERDSKYLLRWALFLLAQFREKRTYLLLVSLLKRRSSKMRHWVGDMVTEDLPRILASVYDGDPAPLKQVVENREMDEYVRAGVLRAFVTLVVTGGMSREEAIEYFRRLFEEVFGEYEAGLLWTNLVRSAVELHGQELEEHIERAFEEEVLEFWFDTREEMEDRLDDTLENVLLSTQSDHHNRLVEDVIAETVWWACFEQHSRDAHLPKELRSPSPAPPFGDTPSAAGAMPEPAHHAVGRNAPCPCGSGKKYKKCCGRA